MHNLIGFLEKTCKTKGGYPCANTAILLLKDDLSPASSGELG